MSIFDQRADSRRQRPSEYLASQSNRDLAMLSIPSLSTDHYQSHPSATGSRRPGRKLLKPIDPVQQARMQVKNRFRLARLELGKAPTMQQQRFAGAKKRDYLSIDLQAHERVLENMAQSQSHRRLEPTPAAISSRQAPCSDWDEGAYDASLRVQSARDLTISSGDQQTIVQSYYEPSLPRKSLHDLTVGGASSSMQSFGGFKQSQGDSSTAQLRGHQRRSSNFLRKIKLVRKCIGPDLSVYSSARAGSKQK